MIRIGAYLHRRGAQNGHPECPEAFGRKRGFAPYPEVAEILELSRSSVYERAKDGSIQTIPFGRLRKVPTAWLRRMLELDDPAE